MTDLYLGDYPELSEDPRALLERHWQAFILPRLSIQRRQLPWQMRLSPPFPQDWPPNLLTRFSYYAYAEALDALALVGALRISQPFACASARLRHPRAARIETYTANILPAGVQEIHSRTTQELAQAQPPASLEELWEAAITSPASPSPPGPDQARASLHTFLSYWLGANLVIAGLISPHHRELFNWLENRK